MKSRSTFSTYRIVFIAVMAAIVCVITFFRFPLLGSKVHLANGMCLLSGLLLGPLSGGLAAGLGSALYDLLFGGYDLVQCLITFVSKFLMAAVCAWLAGTQKKKSGTLRTAVSAIAGAVTYVALYMLKTYVYQRFVYGYPLDTTWLTMTSKLPASLINAVVGVLASVILYVALRPALEKAKVLEQLDRS